MPMKEFMNNCTACGGNWVAMLLSGIKRVFPEHYNFVVAEVDKIGYGKGGVPAFAYICNWLEEHGVVSEEED